METQVPKTVYGVKVPAMTLDALTDYVRTRLPLIQAGMDAALSSAIAGIDQTVVAEYWESVKTFPTDQFRVGEKDGQPSVIIQLPTTNPTLREVVGKFIRQIVASGLKAQRIDHRQWSM